MTIKRALAVMLVVVAAPAHGSEQLRMNVTPRLSMQPGTITVRLTVEPDAENRMLRIVAESADFFRSSEIQLDGDDASWTNMLQYRDLPAGEYRVRSLLVGRDGKTRAFADAFATIIN